MGVVVGEAEDLEGAGEDLEGEEEDLGEEVSLPCNISEFLLFRTYRVCSLEYVR